jgi:hypothetical protein
MLHIARVVAATMLVIGAFLAVTATNFLYDGMKGHLDPDWLVVAVSSGAAIAGLVALVFIEPRLRRKN